MTPPATVAPIAVELGLPEADREREQRGAAQAGEPEREDRERGLVVRELRDRDEQRDEQQGNAR